MHQRHPLPPEPDELVSSSTQALTDIASPLTTPVSRGSVVTIVLERIRRSLIEGRLKPGDFLPSENELARSLGVGKSSIREATKMLQAIGILEVSRGHGTRICEHPGEDAINSLAFRMILERGVPQEIMDLRIMFEPAYMCMAMNVADADDLKAIGITVDELEKAINEGRQNSGHDLAFHRTILHATRNPLVILIGETILELFTAAFETSMVSLPGPALNEHKAIFEAFARKNEVDLRKAIAESSKRWERYLIYR